MKKYYFTFGCGQHYERNYVVIEAKSWDEARVEMVRRFGTQWAFQYDEKDWYIDQKETVYQMFCRLRGFDPDRNEPISQADLYGLILLK